VSIRSHARAEFINKNAMAPKNFKSELCSSFMTELKSYCLDDQLRKCGKRELASGLLTFLNLIVSSGKFFFYKTVNLDLLYHNLSQYFTKRSNERPIFTILIGFKTWPKWAMWLWGRPLVPRSWRWALIYYCTFNSQTETLSSTWRSMTSSNESRCCSPFATTGLVISI
jgi:hypothetical protein